MEYLDILDRNGNKTGEVKPRKEVHSKGYWHKGVHVWIINSQKELLVQKRSAIKDVYPNKLYVSAGGHFTSGEDEKEGIRREILEEIGVEIPASQLQYLFTFSQEVSENNGTFLDNMFYDVYLAEVDLDLDKLKLQEEEVSEVINIPYQEFEKMIQNHDPNIVNHPEGYAKLFKILHERYDEKEWDFDR